MDEKAERKAFNWLSEEVRVVIEGKPHVMKRVHHILHLIKDSNPEAYEVVRKSYNRRMRQYFSQSIQNIGLTSLIPLVKEFDNE